MPNARSGRAEPKASANNDSMHQDTKRPVGDEAMEALQTSPDAVDAGLCVSKPQEGGYANGERESLVNVPSMLGEPGAFELRDLSKERPFVH